MLPIQEMMMKQNQTEKCRSANNNLYI